MSAPDARPRLLVVGGTGGLVGRAVRAELLSRYRVRSVHRHPVEAESTASVEWVSADVGTLPSWEAALEGVDVVLNLAWYRWSSESNFRRLREGTGRLITAVERAGVRRFLQISVPAAPETIERELPYLRYKRELDLQLASSGLSYRILRPTMLFGPNDRLLGVMLRLMHRYHRFPMFGDGEYHVSPIAVADLAHAIGQEIEGAAVGTVDLGGSVRYRYRDLTDAMFAALGRPARYWSMSVPSALRLTRLMVAVGSTQLYPYEVEWLTSDLLGLPPYRGLDRPLAPVAPYLESEADRLRGGRTALRRGPGA